MFKIIKIFFKKIIYYPFGLKSVGNESYILLPRKIINGKYMEVGDRLFIGRHSIINIVDIYEHQVFSPQLIIGTDVYIGGYAQIHCAEKIIIGDGCVFSEHVYISDISHGFDPNAGLILKQDITRNPVNIGSNTFIGFGSSILPGVTLGSHCIVGTNSVVTKSFPDFSMLAGSPAKIIKRYNSTTQKWEKINNNEQSNEI